MLLALGGSHHAWLPARADSLAAEIRPGGADDVHQLEAVLREWWAAAPRRRVQVILDDALARFFVVRPPIGVAGLAELRAVTAARFEDLFGHEASSWSIEADWDARRHFLACAVPQRLVQALREAFPSAASIAPAFVHCLADRESAAYTGWLVHSTRQHVTAAWHGAQGVTYVRSCVRPTDIRSWLAQQALLAAQPMDRLRVFDADSQARVASLARGAEVVEPATLPRELMLIARIAQPLVDA
jgi:hypothetical protein